MTTGVKVAIGIGIAIAIGAIIYFSVKNGASAAGKAKLTPTQAEKIRQQIAAVPLKEIKPPMGVPVKIPDLEKIQPLIDKLKDGGWKYDSATQIISKV